MRSSFSLTARMLAVFILFALPARADGVKVAITSNDYHFAPVGAWEVPQEAAFIPVIQGAMSRVMSSLLPYWNFQPKSQDAVCTLELDLPPVNPKRPREALDKATLTLTLNTFDNRDKPWRDFLFLGKAASDYPTGKDWIGPISETVTRVITKNLFNIMGELAAAPIAREADLPPAAPPPYLAVVALFRGDPDPYPSRDDRFRISLSSKNGRNIGACIASGTDMYRPLKKGGKGLEVRVESQAPGTPTCPNSSGLSANQVVWSQRDTKVRPQTHTY